jgi:DNA adenine methylase
MISNHDTVTSRVLYERASKIETVLVSRTISCNGAKREKAEELIAVFGLDPKRQHKQADLPFAI